MARAAALLRRRLRARLAAAAARGLLSVTLDLGAGKRRALAGRRSRASAAQLVGAAAEAGRDSPQRTGAGGDFRLAIGSAMSFTSAGPARFSALQAAFSGLAPVWEHDDWQHTGFVPAAHIGFAFAENTERWTLLTICRTRACWCRPFCWPIARVAALPLSAARCAKVKAPSNAGAAPCVLLSRQIGRQSGRQPRQRPVVHRRSAALADRAFLARARAALAAIAGGGVDKLVLARSVHFDSEQAHCPAAVLAALAVAIPNAPSTASVSASSVSRCDARASGLAAPRCVEADALAGTAWLAAAAAGSRLAGSAARQEHPRAAVGGRRRSRRPAAAVRLAGVADGGRSPAPA
jgi:hypothetical protein